MTVSPGTSRKFRSAMPMLLLLFAKQNAYLRKSVQKVPLPSKSSQENRHNASSNLTPLLSKLSWSRESLADELYHSGVDHPGLDCRRSRYLTNGMANFTTILQG